MNSYETYLPLFVTFEVFQFEISGKDSNDEHSPNIKFIFFTYEVFHFDISGKYFNDEQLQKIRFIFVTF